MTTEQTTNTTHYHGTPPRWMNLDGYCPPEIRLDLDAAIDQLEDLLDDGSEFAQVCQRAYRAARAYMAATEDAAPEVDDPTVTFGPFTGWAAFDEVVTRLGVMVACASGDVGMGLPSDPTSLLPVWYRPVTETVSPTGDTPVTTWAD